MAHSNTAHSTTRRRASVGVARLRVGLLVVALAGTACASSLQRNRAQIAAAGSLEAIDPGEFVGGLVTSAGSAAGAPGAGATDDRPTQAGTSGGTGPRTGSRSGTTRTTAPNTPGPRPTASQPTAGSGPGISDDKIKIGFIIPGTEQTESSFSFSLPPDGDVRAQIDALAKHINDSGGMFGRSIEPILYFHNIQEASQRKENEICTKFTEDDHVFAIVLNAQIHEATRHCYARHNTLMMESSLFGFDQEFFDQLSPYYWSPNMPAMSSVLRGLITHLETVGYWNPRSTGEVPKLGVMVWDLPSYVRMFDQDVVPTLAQLGRSVTAYQRVNAQDANTIQSGLSAGVSKFKAAGVNRVIFVGTAPLAPFFVLTAKGQNFEPRYGMSTYDNPYFYETYEPAQGQIEDMVGIGFSASADVSDPAWPFPSPNPQEQACMQIMDAAGQHRPARKNAQLALYACDALFLLTTAANKVNGPLTPATWGGAAETLGASWQAANGWGWRLGPGAHDAGTSYRGIKWDTSCSCVVYTTPPAVLPND